MQFWDNVFREEETVSIVKIFMQETERHIIVGLTLLPSHLFLSAEDNILII